MGELSEIIGITRSGIWRLVKKGILPCTYWKGNIFFNEYQQEYAERYAERVPRRGVKRKLT